MKALELEIKACAGEYSDYAIKAVKISGGMGTLIDGRDLERLFRLLRDSFVFSQPYITLTVSPFGISGDRTTSYRRIGVSLYDLEFITLNDEDCMRYGFVDPTDALAYTLPMLHALEENNTGAIVLIGEKEMRPVSLKKTLRSLALAPISHITLQACVGALAGSNTQLQDNLKTARAVLCEYNFSEYLPMHFSRNSVEDMTARMKDESCDILAFGLGAESRIDGVISRVTNDLDRYLQYSGDFQSIVETVEAMPQ